MLKTKNQLKVKIIPKIKDILKIKKKEQKEIKN